MGWLSRIFTIYSSAWLSLGVLVALSVYGQVSEHKSRAWVDHTFKVLEEVQGLESELLSTQANAQSSNRIEALIDYQGNLRVIRASLDRLTELTADNPVQQENLIQLNRLLEKKVLSNKRFMPSSITPLYDDPVRGALSSVKQNEQKLLAKRIAEANRQGLISSLILALGVTTSVSLFAWSGLNSLKQKKIKVALDDRLSVLELEQDLSSHLLTCRNSQEAHSILLSFFEEFLKDCPGAIFEINNSRDQMIPTVAFNGFQFSEYCSPKECWALRRGEARFGRTSFFRIPCKLCTLLYGNTVPEKMACYPVQAHEQTIGILHLDATPTNKPIAQLVPQIALPLAVLRLQETLEYISFHDSNTGIYNRRFLDEMLTRSILEAERKNYQIAELEKFFTVGILFLDIDFFKQFNTNYGHEVGDNVLKILGNLLKGLTRAGVDIAARYGGEEFVVILPGATLSQSTAKAELIRVEISKESLPQGGKISVSIGVAAYPEHGSSGDEVLRQANLALLRAKQNGKNQVVAANNF